MQTQETEESVSWRTRRQGEKGEWLFAFEEVKGRRGEKWEHMGSVQ